MASMNAKKKSVGDDVVQVKMRCVSTDIVELDSIERISA